MTRLVQIITAAIAVIAGYRSTIKEQAETIKQQADKIDELQTQHEADGIDDAALEEAAKAAGEARAVAEEKLAELQDPELETEANKLAELLNTTDEAPSINPETFTVTEQPTA